MLTFHTLPHMEASISVKLKRVLIGPFVYSNPYCRLFQKSLESVFDVNGLGRWDFKSRYHAVFLSWVENSTESDKVLIFLRKCLVLLVRVLMQRRRNAKIVMTLHNRFPHGARFPTLRSWFQRILYAIADKVIVHSLAAKNLAIRWGLEKKVIYYPHPSYQGIYPKPPCRKGDTTTVNIGLLGFIKPYKGAESLIQVFRRTTREDLRLHISGQAVSRAYEDELQALAAGDSRIHLDFRFLSDVEFVGKVQELDLLVFPYLGGALLTSGMATMACTLGIPFVTRNEPLFEEYRHLKDYRSFETEQELQEILESSEIRINYSQRLYDYSRQFTWEEFARKLSQSI